MDKLLLELRKLLDKLKEYKSLDSEGRTEERRSQNKTDMARIKEVEEEIRELEEIEEIETRNAQSINKPPGSSPEFQRMDQEDAPIYRGHFQLGQQMRDIVSAGDYSNTESRQDALGRLGQVEKRALNQFGIDSVEERAAGDGMSAAVGADGAFLLQGESAQDLFTKGFNNNAILSRTSSRTISSQSLEIMGIDESSRVKGSRGGGVRVYTQAELEQMTESKTKFTKIKIEPKLLTGLYFASDQILSDVPGLSGEMESLFKEDFAYKGQELIFDGSGSGEALGVNNSKAPVEVAKVSGQTAGTIVAQNILDMVARAWMRSMQNLVWVCNQECYPQLATLAYATDKQNAPLFIPNANPGNGSLGTLAGFPVIPIEQCEGVGTSGDLMLCDFSQYITANRGAINSAMSIHLKFDYNQTCFRFLYRFDGQPKWSKPLTPAKGTKTVSPFVKLADRK